MVISNICMLPIKKFALLSIIHKMSITHQYYANNIKLISYLKPVLKMEGPVEELMADLWGFPLWWFFDSDKLKSWEIWKIKVFILVLLSESINILECHQFGFGPGSWDIILLLGDLILKKIFKKISRSSKARKKTLMLPYGSVSPFPFLLQQKLVLVHSNQRNTNPLHKFWIN